MTLKINTKIKKINKNLNCLKTGLIFQGKLKNKNKIKILLLRKNRIMKIKINNNNNQNKLKFNKIQLK